ncbi:DUF2382 domain-containing protein [Terribacillus sp. DMT04]|uniref:DUF2382 domain-containing protein n=1 Tax=Terribacillus sp. DMT04 TaxID=2850441 RepID=UPI001C2BC03A|nr:DUF2382 domain-containing protein [Terribacillus sp. DMT04]QXE00718.1 DUF2382 domain-containing protein [Terribacillus sp. DMT04]
MLAQNIETYQNENDVIVRVNELKSKGIQEDKVTVITDKKPDASILADRLSVNYKEAKGSFGDKVSAMFSGDKPEEKTLHELNLNERETDQYADELKNGKILLFIDPAARKTLEKEDDSIAQDPIDANNTAYTETDNTAFTEVNKNPAAQPGTSQKEQMELHEEVVDVERDTFKAGEVNVDKRTVTDREEFDVPVNKQEVNIERRPVNKVSDKANAAGAYTEKDGIHVPVYEEKVDVDKKDVIKEEIVVNKKDVQENVHVNENVKREEAEIKDTTKKDSDLK